MRAEQSFQHITLVLIMVVGALLRLKGFFSPQFTFDELGTVCRLQYDRIHDLIYYGVFMSDTHPTGVQVLMWQWSKNVGTTAVWMRMPMLIMSIASIFLIYNTANRLGYGNNMKQNIEKTLKNSLQRRFVRIKSIYSIQIIPHRTTPSNT